MYEIRYSNSAERYFKKIRDKQLLRVFKCAIDKLKDDPYTGTQKSGDLRGFYGCDVKYKGVNYELAYRIYEENGRFVVIILAGTRENFYDKAVNKMRGCASCPLRKSAIMHDNANCYKT